MGRAFVYVIIGGGVAAGYAAHEFAKRGVSHDELCIISGEPVAPYERPALSKGYLFPEAPARLPSFHCCVGTNDERLTPNWYREHGIELILGTLVQSVDVSRKTLLTATGETISYKYLIVATGARAVKLEEFGVMNGSNAPNVCYLRDLADADRLVDLMQSCAGRNAVVVGGGYLGMECAAALVMNKLNVTMVFPKPHFLTQLFTPKIARYYEEFYESKGVKFIKGTVATSFDLNSRGEVAAVNLKNGSKLQADMALISVGASPNTALFEGQLTMEKKGIKVNGKMQSSNTSVFAIGDVAAFPLKFVGETRRIEHVDFARKSARHAVAAIMEPAKTGELDYLPFFYSRVFTLSWQFYGNNAGEVVHFGGFNGNIFGAYWIHKGRLVGCFLEGGSKQQYDAVAESIRRKPLIKDLVELETRGLEFVLSLKQETPTDSGGGGCRMITKKLICVWRATAGVTLAVSIAVFAYWYGARCNMW